jgi:hypothetical protein
LFVAYHRFVPANVDRQISGQHAVFSKVALDIGSPVAKRDGKLIKSEVGVYHHDVPEDRPAADLYHRFRPNGRLFRQTRALATGENRYFQRVRSLPMSPIQKS